MKEAELPNFLLEHTLWEKEASSIWPATSFTLRRNLAKYNFPSKLDARGANQILELAKNALLSCPELDRPVFLAAEEVSPLNKEYLFEHFLCLESFQNTQSGQGFLVDGSGRFFGRINIQDHLLLQLVDTKAEWEKAYNLLASIEKKTVEGLECAYSPKFGYLTSDPALCGTGLLVQAYLHLPALIHTKGLQLQEETVTAMGLQGTLDDLVGDLVVLKNQYTLGVTEESILHVLHMSAMKLIVAEKTLRSTLHDSAHFKDLVSRAYGLLIHSFQLQTKEALDAISLLKLGLDLGWIAGIDESKLNELFFRCRHAHLSKLQPSPPPDLAHERAAFIHEQLKPLQLKI